MARVPRPGQLRDAVYFERRSVLDNGRGKREGAFERFWPSSGSTAADIIPIRGREDVLAGRLQGVTVYEIVVRYNSTLAGLSERDRVVDARSGSPATVFNIRAIVNPDGKKRFLHLTCEKGMAT